jgi:hypothetical protein
MALGPEAAGGYKDPMRVDKGRCQLFLNVQTLKVRRALRPVLASWAVREKDLRGAEWPHHCFGVETLIQLLLDAKTSCFSRAVRATAACSCAFSRSMQHTSRFGASRSVAHDAQIRALISSGILAAHLRIFLQAVDGNAGFRARSVS